MSRTKWVGKSSAQKEPETPPHPPSLGDSMPAAAPLLGTVPTPSTYSELDNIIIKLEAKFLLAAERKTAGSP